MIFFNTILPSAIAIAIVFLFGCLGETITEKAGHLNLGIPGIMCMGTLGGCIGISIVMGFYTSNPENASWFLIIIFSLVFSVIFSAFGGLIYGFITVSLKGNQNVTGLALTTFGAGLCDFFLSDRVNKTNFSYASKVFNYHLPFGDYLGVFGNIFINYSFVAFIAIGLAIASSLLLKKSRIGLNLRAVGENPATADAAGIPTSKYKYAAIIIGSSIAGIGGLFYVMGYVGGSWENSSTIQAFGWLALALVIFSCWKPALSIGGSILFGLLYVLPTYITGISTVQKNIISLLPYVVTIIVLIVTSIIGKKSVQPPASLGLSYFREDR